MSKLLDYIGQDDPVTEFRVKFACEPKKRELDNIIRHLKLKYDAYDVTPLHKTMFHAFPLDFANLDAGEIWMFDFSTKRHISPEQLLYDVCALISWSESLVRVRNKSTPYQEERDGLEDDLELDEYTPRLSDPNYSEHDDSKNQSFAGQERVDTVLSELETERKSRYTEFFAAGYNSK